MKGLTIELYNRTQAWSALKDQLFPFLKEVLQNSKRWVLSVKPESRTLAQNRLMWPILTEFSKQLEWPVNGRISKMTPEDWKDVLTAAHKKESVRLAMGIDGGVVMLGQRTSGFSKQQFTDFIEFLYATAADREVDLPEWESVNDD